MFDAGQRQAFFLKNISLYWCAVTKNSDPDSGENLTPVELQLEMNRTPETCMQSMNTQYKWNALLLRLLIN